VAEVLQSGNQEHFQRIAGVEIVSIEDLTEKLLAQAVISPGITKVYLELLTATTDSNEIYIVPVPAPWEGKPFGQVATLLHEGERPTIALGYRTTSRSGHPVMVLNPQRSKTERHGVVDWWNRPLEVGDALIVMAYEAPGW
jgi:Trk K+ transport system NAD-binding subunit